jgi:hypothetical protein
LNLDVGLEAGFRFMLPWACRLKYTPVLEEGFCYRVILCKCSPSLFQVKLNFNFCIYSFEVDAELNHAPGQNWWER